jgi:hypothetical protein
LGIPGPAREPRPAATTKIASSPLAVIFALQSFLKSEKWVSAFSRPALVYNLLRQGLLLSLFPLRVNFSIAMITRQKAVQLRRRSN